VLSITFKYHKFLKVIGVIVFITFFTDQTGIQFCLKNALEWFLLVPRLKSTASQVFVLSQFLVPKTALHLQGICFSRPALQILDANQYEKA